MNTAFIIIGCLIWFAFNFWGLWMLALRDFGLVTVGGLIGLVAFASILPVASGFLLVVWLFDTRIFNTVVARRRKRS